MNNKNTNRTPPCDSSKKVYHLINYHLNNANDKTTRNFKILKVILSLRQLQKPRAQCQKSILGSVKATS